MSIFLLTQPKRSTYDFLQGFLEVQINILLNKQIKYFYPVVAFFYAIPTPNTFLSP